MTLRNTSLAACLAFLCASVQAQDGLRLPARSEGAGLDPSFAAGWLNPARERLGFSPYHWRDAIGFAPTRSMQWSYAFGSSSLGMSVASGRDFDATPMFGMETRRYGLFGRYSLAQEWSVSAETVSREPGSLFRLQDFRVGLRRQF